MAIALAGGAVAYVARDDSGRADRVRVDSPAPPVVVREVAAPEQAAELGFPAFATKNTTRIAGSDPGADAAGAALAVFPSTGGVEGPDAVSIVDAADWQAGIAAAALAAAPVSAPILVSDGGELSEFGADALADLDPQGSARTAGRQAFVLGGGAVPDGLETLELEQRSPVALAAAVDRLRERLAGKPEHIVIASSREPALAMPAAAWAARSGDPVLFVSSDRLPEPTRKALESHEGVPVYVLGPQAAVSAKAVAELRELGADVRRVGAEDPVENAIEFARYNDAGFGWDINDPGHGFVIASASRPLDAAAAAPLSASGTWGPLLVSAAPEALDAALRGYLLDLKPGYADDPTRAVYNHLWLIGDPAAISVEQQAQLDEIAEVAPVSSGPGAGAPAPQPAPESQPSE